MEQVGWRGRGQRQDKDKHETYLLNGVKRSSGSKVVLLPRDGKEALIIEHVS